MFSLSKKVIVITGSNGLLGSQILKSIKDQGAIAIGVDVNYENDLTNCNLIQMDICSELSIENAIQSIINNYGKIDGWVNNAYPRTNDWSNKFEDIDFNSWRENIDMHLNGYFICCKKILSIMSKQRNGSLINMSSIYGIIAPDFDIYNGTNMTMPAAYSAIKGGINALTKYLASYYGKFNVRVNSVSPGGILNNQPEIFVKNYTSKVPLSRMGNPDDVIAAICFLLSDETSYITGHNLVVDGGFSII